MALSANQVVEIKQNPYRLTLKVVSGLIHIYKGAILNYASGNIGYVKLGADALTNEFAGIALDELNVSAADNGADGTFSILVIPRGSGELVLMNITDSITIADEGAAVYVNGDDAVKKSVTNVTGGFVGIIRQFVSTNKAWVQMCQSVAK